MGYEKDFFGSFEYEFEHLHKSRRSRVYHQDIVLHIINSQELYIIIAKGNTAYGWLYTRFA